MTERKISDFRHLRWPLRLTRAGMAAEQVVRAFWPAWSLAIAALAVLMLGLHEMAPVEVVWFGGLLVIVLFLALIVHGLRRLTWPRRADALARLDASLPGRPLAALADQQAIGAGDEASRAVWQAHQDRMAARSAEARAVEPDLRISGRDPYALRYVALLAFLVAVLFGSFLKVSTLADAAGTNGSDLALGPAWEGWVEPPAYTGRPSLYLNDITQAAFAVPEGSTITLRLYGEIGALTVDETVSARTGEIPPATEPSQRFEVSQEGRIAIDGPGGRSWDIVLIADSPPEVELTAPLEPSANGELRQAFAARDDYGVISGRAVIELDQSRLTRRYGLATDPDPRAPIELDLPMTISGDRGDFEETLIDDTAKHPWAGLPVTLSLGVTDAAGQTGESAPSEVTLPARRWFDPLAGAIIEQRRDLLWSRANAPRVAAVLRAVSHLPEDLFRSETAFLKLRVAVRRLETSFRYASVSQELQEETAEILWEIALQIEEGDLSDALERLRRAQDRLSDAIRNGATDEEIAELMQELREAMQDYMRQLAEQMGEQDGDQQAQRQDGQEITGDQLQEMLDRLQELMEQGRMDEAQALLEQLRQMMENMQMAQQQPGQGQNPGQQAMEDLAETLRDQQGLSDEAFRDLQEQFGQNGQRGQERPGQRGQQQGEGQDPGEGEGQDGQSGTGMSPGEELANRQGALRDRLNRQQQNLPGAGTPQGDAARESLDRAGRAMDGAEEALRDEDFAGALDEQSEAIEALREGLRELGEALAQQQQQPGNQGMAATEGNPQGQRDPLGREAGQNGRIGTDERLLQDDDVYRRARELLDEIRRRSGDQTRPDAELEYLKRLLDRF
jgi:uncharacterized protein (TIGR02302 family)